MPDEKKSRRELADDFWDIENLLPQRAAPKMTPRPPEHVQAVELELPDPTPRATAETVADGALSPSLLASQSAKPNPPNGVRRYVPPHTAQDEKKEPTPDEEYTPNHPLIHRVRLYRWKTNYNYYEDFYRDAIRLLQVKGIPCEPVSFFSYVPQYNQLNRAQLAWYLWWREQVRGGIYPKADESYLLLYAYEIINTAGDLNPLAGQRALADLWLAYRDMDLRLDRYFAEWLCDFSLIHRLPPPAEVCSLPTSVIADCTLREFYLAGGQGREASMAQALMLFCSNYNPRKSKFATPENLALYQKYVPGAILQVLKELPNDAKRFFTADRIQDSRLTRDAYTGALCSYRCKRRMEVDYCSFSRSHELRFFVTDLIKYTENKIRAHLGVKSRLSVERLSAQTKALLDRYFAQEIPPAKRDAEPGEIPAYEKFYDVPPKPFSPEEAAAIEKQSWETTEKLVQTFADEQEETGKGLGEKNELSTTADAKNTPAVPAQKNAAKPLQTEPFSDFSMPDFCSDTAAFLDSLGELLPLFSAMTHKDGQAQRKIADSRGKPLSLLADEINEKAADLLGDILLEEQDGIFVVIEDYQELFYQ